MPAAPEYDFVLSCWSSAPKEPHQRFRIVATLVNTGIPASLRSVRGRIYPEPVAVGTSSIYETPAR